MELLLFAGLCQGCTKLAWGGQMGGSHQGYWVVKGAFPSSPPGDALPQGQNNLTPPLGVKGAPFPVGHGPTAPRATF